MFEAYFLENLCTIYLPMLWQGLLVTLQLVVLSGISGFLLSLPIALARFSRHRLRRVPAKIYIFFFRGTPLLVQLFLIYYGISQLKFIQNSWLWAVLESPFWCGYIALTLNTAAYLAQILYGGITSIPEGEIRAARALGMSRLLRFKRIIVPRAFRLALPNYSNEIILLIKGSALTSTITLMDLTGATRTVIAETYMAVEFYVIAGLMYVALCSVVAIAFRVLEKFLSPWLKAERGNTAINIVGLGR